MMQAVARLRTQHGEFSAETWAHLVQRQRERDGRTWRSIAQGDIERSGSQGGSVSRANFIATILATEHNRGVPEDAQLHTALSRPRAPRPWSRRPSLSPEPTAAIGRPGL